MHKQFLLAALEQAWLGRGLCAPNPSVGTVAVVDDKIIAQNYHRGAGTLHAEQLLLNSLTKGIKNVTLYVTLEPCNHWGKTPPCVDIIRDYGVSRVVYAYPDPNPTVVANNTPKILKERGIEVIRVNVPEIDAFYKSYTYWTKTKKPFITLKVAQSLDGKIAKENGKPISISCDISNDFTHRQRQCADILITSAKTIKNDAPSFNVRLNDKTLQKPLAIIDRNAELAEDAKVLQTTSHCYIFHGEDKSVLKKYGNCTYIPTPVKDDKLSLEHVIATCGQLGFHDAWVEVGGTILAELLTNNLVQKAYFYIAPKFLGENGTANFSKVQELALDGDVSCKLMGRDVLLSLNFPMAVDL